MIGLKYAFGLSLYLLTETMSKTSGIGLADSRPYAVNW
jgi:hypothetical protein